MSRKSRKERRADEARVLRDQQMSEALDRALELTYPASDPVSIPFPHVSIEPPRPSVA